ncbi:MAG TPA: MBL fold metallo-hydrolase [Polyangiaceae bacterium]|nr:MBL fold metallo-hydrolase [Polyangiaceae bacterium]
MLFRQLFDAQTSTFSYLLADERSRKAMLIDSVFEQHLRDLALIRELELSLCLSLDTHVHADHVTGAWLMKEALGSEIVASRAGGAQGCDRLLVDGDVLELGALRVEARATPGHTAGCLSFVLHEQKLIFSGDALLIRGAGRTDFQQGDPAQLFHSVRERLLTLPDDFTIYPGHDYSGRCSSSVAEERRHNPRLGDGVRLEDFIGYMANLGLPHPKRLAVAVPANLVSGRPETPAQGPPRPDWGPVVRTFAGVWQVEPEFVFAHRDELRVIDVRELEEVKASPLGAILGSRVMPLSGLRARVAEVPRDRPIVLVCPAGARSAIAATILESAGVERVANMRGGLLEWRSLGLPGETNV